MTAPPLVFLDGNELRLAELRRLIPGIEITVEHLQSGFSTSDPEPKHRARDKVAAHPVHGGCFAEAEDMTTMDGKSLRLELDSENDSRFCKWWREREVELHLCIALRRSPTAEIEFFAATCAGRIADRPMGPQELGWDRLFVPTTQPPGQTRTLAELTAHGLTVDFRRAIYGELAHALGLTPAPAT
jgi:inosine/xanthosine triphosphate pyrophosphatase family protein